MKIDGILLIGAQFWSSFLGCRMEVWERRMISLLKGVRGGGCGRCT
jgi:hypothetical protein